MMHHRERSTLPGTTFDAFVPMSVQRKKSTHAKAGIWQRWVLPGLLIAVATVAQAKELVIQNDLSVDLYFTEVLNRQNVNIRSKPPEVVASGQSASFEVGWGTTDFKNRHIRVQYAAGWASSSDLVIVGLRMNVSDKDWKCLISSSNDAAATHVGASQRSPTTYKFYYSESP